MPIGSLPGRCDEWLLLKSTMRSRGRRPIAPRTAGPFKGNRKGRSMGLDMFYWVIYLIELACAIIIFVKYKGTPVAILGGIGFALLFILPILRDITFRFGYSPYEFNMVFGMIGLGARGCILAAIILLPARQRHESFSPDASQSQAYHHYSGPGGPISRQFYLGSITGGLGATILLSIISISLSATGEAESGLAFAILAFIPLIYATVIIAMLVHKMWQRLQDGQVRTTPGQAVGFLFIPLFNFYWIFQAYWGFAQDYNKYISARGLNISPMSEKLALTVCVLAICSIIPFVGILIGIVNLVFLTLFFAQVCDRLNALDAHTSTSGSAQV